MRWPRIKNLVKPTVALKVGLLFMFRWTQRTESQPCVLRPKIVPAQKSHDFFDKFLFHQDKAVTKNVSPYMIEVNDQTCDAVVVINVTHSDGHVVRRKRAKVAARVRPMIISESVSREQEVSRSTQQILV